MPLYEYQCVDCSERDQRIAGLDDHTALCAKSGGLMLRLEGDLSPRILQCQFYRFGRSAMLRKNLEFEVRWRLRELIREHGVTVVMNSDTGQKLLKNLQAIEASKSLKQAA